MPIKKTTEEWFYPSTKEVLAEFWNAMLKRCDQMDKWKAPPSNNRAQKELQRVIDKYSKRINATSGKRQTIELKFDANLGKTG